MAASSEAEQRLFLHLYEKIISREITTFANLVDYVSKLKYPVKSDKVIYKSFQLLKELHWGFFKDLNRADYTRLWKELVLPYGDFKEGGDLKRNISVSNIFVAMLDIHGYTKFCQESKGNLSRLRKLDEFLHDGIKKIAGRNHALATRERGDEIIIIAASATDAIKTTLEIINSFSKRSVIKDRSLQSNRKDFSIILPDFKITAGIAGGNLTTPLIITESGLLSGYLINTAARLQSRANELSPKESKIMAVQSVYNSYLKENKVVKNDLYAKNLIFFFNNGPVSFKGVKLYSYEIIFKNSERYREKYVKLMEVLYDSLKQQLWKQKIFLDLMAAVSEALSRMAPFSVEVTNTFDPDQRGKITNAFLLQLCTKASQLYDKEDDYPSAISLLGQIQLLLEQVPGFDRLLYSYVAEVNVKYSELMKGFNQKLEREIEERIDSIFNEQYKTAYLNSKKAAITYDKLRSYAKKSKALSKKKFIWYNLIEENRDTLELEIYSGKK